MPAPEDLLAHYSHGGLIEAIEAGLASLGKTPAGITIEDLAPLDEFHIGGRKASEEFLDQLTLSPAMRALDIGCGLGGAARFAAARYGCRVAGIDLTAEYVETGQVLTRWLRLDDRVLLQTGSALALPFGDAVFDAAYMLHVGMNIADKAALCAEVARILRPGARFGVYDVMRTGGGALAYPVPWASSAELCAIATPEEYRLALRSAGFELVRERDRRDFALDHFNKLRAKAAGAPPLGTHMLMGKTAPDKVRNMIQNISAGRVAPVELIARKP